MAAPAHLAVDARGVPKARYLSPDFLSLELERIFRRTWLVAGPASDLEHPGSFFTFEIAGESILVVRGDDGARAFHNVCQHRGRALRDPGRGQARTFRCPYHHWEYALDGTLIAVPEAASFASCPRAGAVPLGTRGSLPIAASRESLGLTPVACELWQGLVWVHLGASPEPLSEFLGTIGPRIAAYDLASYVLEQDQTLDLDCNWKVGVDAFNEAYHLRAVHPELLELLDETRATLELEGAHSVIRVPFGEPSPSAPHRDAIGDLLGRWMRDAGLEPETYRGPLSGVRDAVRATLRARTDIDVAGLDDDQLTDNFQFYVFPNLTLNVYATRLMLLRHRPHPTDPGRMLLDQQQYARIPRDAKRSRPTPEVGRFGSGSLGFVTDQDTHNLVRVQRGMQSSGFERLVLGSLERRLAHMHETMDRYLFGASSG
ncbi:MAG: aromatic ring-hydroxylating dioxygenase subunit alpha [Myxococcota bacterium]|nr:aromatic ring-hydroxylating dioxygenase subunit alpha [Myxococcota bacterium]